LKKDCGTQGNDISGEDDRPLGEESGCSSGGEEQRRLGFEKRISRKKTFFLRAIEGSLPLIPDLCEGE